MQKKIKKNFTKNKNSNESKKQKKRKFQNEEDEEFEEDSGPVHGVVLLDQSTNEQDGEKQQSESTIQMDHDNPECLKNPMPQPTDRILQPKRFKNLTNQSKRLIIILERANLEVIKNKQKFELLNTDDHQNLIKKYKKDPQNCRPDILHQCLLMLFDSPLNRCGLLQVFIHTEQNVLIEINPQTRWPRTFKRFSFLMVQLLHKLSIRATNSSDKLLRVIKNPVTSHLPVGCHKIRTSFKAPNLVHPKDLVPKDDQPLAIVIGAMAHGQVNVDYTEQDVSISQYPLSAALTCTKICSAFEECWNII